MILLLFFFFISSFFLSKEKASASEISKGGEVFDSNFINQPNEDQSFKVFGYLPEYRLNGFNYTAAFSTGLTHLIFFSIEVDPVNHVPYLLERLPTKLQAKDARKAADLYNGKILIGFGGNSRSNGFSQMVQTSKTRRKFLKSLNILLRKYNFDGVDYNWEYPTNAEEWRKWGNLMKESKKYLLSSEKEEENGEKVDQDEERKYKKNEDFKKESDVEVEKNEVIDLEKKKEEPIVTFTIYQDERHFDLIKSFDLLKYADYVHCMSYDQYGEHSTFKFAANGVELALNLLGRENAKKFTLGLPFYARHINTGEPKAYGELAPNVTSKSVDYVGKYYFNSVSLIRKKTELAINSSLGGVMIWELGQDLQPLDSHKSLMWGVLEAIKGKTRKEILNERTQNVNRDNKEQKESKKDIHIEL